MRGRNRRDNATSPNNVFVGSYSSLNPPSADFTNTDTVSRNSAASQKFNKCMLIIYNYEKEH